MGRLYGVLELFVMMLLHFDESTKVLPVPELVIGFRALWAFRFTRLGFGVQCKGLLSTC